MKIIIAGDFSPRKRVAELINQQLYGKVLDGVKPIIEDADYSVVNLETAIVGEEQLVPTVKWSPNLSSTPFAVDAIKYAGFKCATLANNHFGDYGVKSVELALSTLDKQNIDHVGGGLNLVEAQKILYKSICGRKVAFINCCEHEMTIASAYKAGCAPLNMVDNYRQIKEAKANADYVIVIIHGGHEHYQLPSPRMKKTYRWFVDLGADVVVNHHQHCYSGYEVYQGKPIFYGLGNFCFDQNDKSYKPWNEGLLVKLDLQEQISFEIIPYKQCADEPNVTLLVGEARDAVMSNIERLNAIIADDQLLANNHKQYCKKRQTDMRMCMSPYTNRILFSLAVRNLLPSFVTKRRALRAIDYIECESHRDVFIDYLYDQL